MIGSKQRPPKIAKQAFIQEEIEVAEVLFGMTRQFQGPLKQESDAVDSRDANAGFANESRSAASPPNTASPHPPSAQQSVLGPSESSSNPSSLPAAAAVGERRSSLDYYFYFYFPLKIFGSAFDLIAGVIAVSFSCEEETTEVPQV